MKYLSTLLIILLFFTFISCGKQSSSSNTGDVNTAKIERDDPVKKIIDENKLKKLVTENNPNTMSLKTTPRDAAQVAAEKKKVEECSEKFLDFTAKNGITAALEEINKARDGAFKEYIPSIHFYLPVMKRTGDTWVIAAHGTTRDYIGIEMVPGDWKDLTTWGYLSIPVEKYLSGMTNRIWTTNVYWKDPGYLEGKEARFDAYNRFLKIENDTYWIHFTIWTDK